MRVKTTGAELKAFWDAPEVWKGDRYIDDVVLVVNGTEVDADIVADLKDSDSVFIECGLICDYENGSEDIAKVFKAWRKKQNTVFISVQCSKELEEAVKNAITAAGGKVS